MKSTVETLSPTRVRLAVEVPFEELKPTLDSTYKSIAKQVRVPGFRPGKVPARIIDQRVGRGAVVQEAVNDALPRLYGQAAREQELQPVGQPEITDISSFDEIVDGAVWHFTAEVDIRPEIELPELDGIEVQVEDAQVTDADVEEQLDELRDRFGTLKGVDRPVAEKDYVSLDLSTAVAGEAIEEGSAKGLSYQVGSGDLLDGLDEALIGKSAQDSAVFTTTLRHGDHSGAEAEVTAKINSVKVKELPEADDEFAQMASEFDTIADLRADLRERLGRVRVLEQGAQARDKLLEQLIEAVDFPLPESAVKSELELREHDVVHALGHDDAMFEQYLESQEKSREEFEEELRDAAERGVRVQFILDTLADKEEVQVGEGELTEYLIAQARRYNMPPQEFANEIVKAGNLPAMMADIRRNKALASVLEHARITDESGNTVDLSALSDGSEDRPPAPEETSGEAVGDGGTGGDA